MRNEIAIHPLPTLTPRHIESLADLLIDCIEAGASVSFMHPLPRSKALASRRSAAATHAPRAAPR